MIESKTKLRFVHKPIHMFTTKISSNDYVITYKYNEINNNATYVHIIDNVISTIYDFFFVVISYLDENVLLV